MGVRVAQGGPLRPAWRSANAQALAAVEPRPQRPGPARACPARRLPGARLPRAALAPCGACAVAGAVCRTARPFRQRIYEILMKSLW